MFSVATETQEWIAICTTVVTRSSCKVAPIITNFEFLERISQKSPNIKFHENLSSGRSDEFF